MHEINSLSLSSSSSIRTPTSAKQRIVNYLGHAIGMLDHLQRQNTQAAVPHKLDEIYRAAREEIYELNSRMHENLDRISPQKEKKIAKLKEQLIKLKLEIADDQAKKEKLLNILSKYQQAETKSQKLDELQEPKKLASDRAKRKAKIEKLKIQLTRLEKQISQSLAKSDSLSEKLKNLESDLSKKEVKDLKEDLAKAEEKIVSIIHRTQIEVVSEIARESSATKDQDLIRDKVASLAKGGWGALWIRFLSLVSTTNQEAMAAFHQAETLMGLASKQAIPDASLKSEMDFGKKAEFERYLKGEISLEKRSGVIGLGGIYRIQVTFSQEKIHKQLKSFMAQNMSEAERTTIERLITINGKAFKNRMIPLNKSFDLFLALRGTLTAVFSSIFGTKGISSANRQESHLVNGYESNLIFNEQTLFRALRHAIASDRYEKDPEMRAQNSRRAAEELLKAALLQEIASQGLTIEEAQKKGIRLNLNSVSLVTPDDVRPFLSGQANEQKMLLDQVLALESFKDTKFLEIDGLQIPVSVHVNTFNFGVNYLSKNLGWGLGNQYEHNLKAMQGFRNQVADLYLNVGSHIIELEEKLKSAKTLDEALALKKEVADLKKSLTNAKHLMADIELLLADKKAYLKGKNQYEIGAKILNLSYLMDSTMDRINHSKPREERISGIKGAFNCMSGKDRTGIMDAMAKTFAVMAEENGGQYPTHEDFKKEHIRKRFAEILGTVLLQGGGLDITEINTGAKGYKVGKEARLFGMPIEQFLQVQGFSSTTSS